MTSASEDIGYILGTSYQEKCSPHLQGQGTRVWCVCRWPSVPGHGSSSSRQHVTHSLLLTDPCTGPAQQQPVTLWRWHMRDWLPAGRAGTGKPCEQVAQTPSLVTQRLFLVISWLRRSEFRPDLQMALQGVLAPVGSGQLKSCCPALGGPAERG